MKIAILLFSLTFTLTTLASAACVDLSDEQFLSRLQSRDNASLTQLYNDCSDDAKSFEIKSRILTYECSESSPCIRDYLQFSDLRARALARRELIEQRFK